MTRMAVAPAPYGQDLDLVIECTSDPRERFGAPHRVIVHPDWTVETPHDLDAERIARSFGGWSTCLLFADRALPTFRRALHVMAHPAQITAGDEPWTAAPQDDDDSDDFCSYPLDPSSLRDSVREEIKPSRMIPGSPSSHAASPEAIDAERKLYTELFSRAGRAWATAGDPRHIDGGEIGFLEVWAQGLLPTHVDELARSLPRSALPLSPQFYSRAHFDDVDVDWLIGAIQCYPDREFADWAVAQNVAWAQTPVEVVWRLYELGLSARDAIGVLEQRVPIDTLVELARRPGVGGQTAARWLTIWARLGVTPTTAHYRLLEANRVLLQRPQSWMLDTTASALRRFGAGAPDRTELAVMLALTTDLGAIERAIRRGARAATDPRFLELIRKENAR
ncbi:MAG: hypothetical protein IJO71_08365 [Microbacterium sp.]|jgi:hypothetical protein|uniref:hypothetical protein n=1 Tax=Microbacterium sp. TaxID=51671 RepID=UPI0025CF3C0E|nr:hypothetical protein [Microbacterium sp.]MBQ9917199.1 hypothetical protein [Microbacterium sp.]